MALLTILEELRDLAIRVEVKEGQLLLKGKTDRIGAELIERIRSNKPALIDLLSRGKAQAQPPAPAIRTRPAERRFEPAALSFAQQRMWFLDRLNPGQSVYNLADASRMSGPLDVGALRRTLNELVARHESLRTVFPEIDGQPRQRVLPRLEVALDVVDLAGLPADRLDAAQRQHVEAEAQAPFDLAHGPLVRFKLLRLSGSEHVVLFTMHHIVSDEWSMGLLLREMAALYAAHVDGRTAVLSPPALQYADYAQWQRESLGGDTLARQLAHWTEALRDTPSLLAMPIDKPRPAVQGHRGALVEFQLDLPTLQGLQRITRQANATLFMTLHAAYAVLLARWSGEDDICVGTPVANRNRPELESVVGFFANTLVMRTKVVRAQPFDELLAQVRAYALAALSHQDLPFDHLVEVLRPERHASHAPLVQTMLTLHGVPRGSVELPGLALTPLPGSHTVAKFDLAFKVTEHEDGLGIVLQYNVDLFEASTIEALARRFRQLVAGIVAAPDTPVGDLAWMDEAERQALQARLRIAATDTLVQRALGRPDLAFDPEAADARADRLAHGLRANGVRAEVPVGVFMPHSPERGIAAGAVMKAGGAAVLLEPALADAELARVLEAVRPLCVLTQRRLLARLPQGVTGVCVDALPARFDLPADGPPAPEVHPDQLACIVHDADPARRAAALPALEIRQQLRRSLPDYMLPQVVLLERMPATLNGKIDRAQLPAPASAWQGPGAPADAAAVPPAVRPLAGLPAVWAVSADEGERLVAQWNDTRGGPVLSPQPAAFGAGLFEPHAHAQAVALQFDGGESLSYGELEARANRLARQLCAMGVQAETPVGICLERSVDMVVAVLAVLKASLSI